MLLPVSCPLCGRPGAAPCGPCADALPRHRGGRQPAGLRVEGVDRVLVALSYEGAARELVARLKYRNRRSSLGWLGRELAGLVEAAPEVEVPREAVVTWVPTTSARRRHRGFDQSRSLARRVAWRLGIPARALLVRTSVVPQTGRSGAERRQGPSFVPRRAVPVHVVLVDDVVTTGATLRAAAAALRAGGARHVTAIAVARTPRRPLAGAADGPTRARA